MKQSLREKINELAEEIRKLLKIKGPISDMDYVVKSLGGEIEVVEALDGFADAKIARVNDSFKITICDWQSQARRRFSIAHELGHLFLHMGFGIDRNMWEENKNNEYFRKCGGEIEYQAHEFAAAFLMPQDLFREVMHKNYNKDGTYDMNKVAEYFDVSVEAAINRGRWLNILSWN